MKKRRSTQDAKTRERGPLARMRDERTGHPRSLHAAKHSRFPDFLNGLVEEVAPKLLGCILERVIDGHVLAARIVEVEAYDQDDAASHAYRGKTARNAVMFGECGHLYVYFTYGMHYCCNVVCGPAGYGSGILIRAAESLEGREIMEAHRGVHGVNATNGPAKLCQALRIGPAFNGHDLRTAPLRLLHGSLRPGETIGQTRRIGISKAVEKLRRYHIAGNPCVSKTKTAG